MPNWKKKRKEAEEALEKYPAQAASQAASRKDTQGDTIGEPVEEETGNEPNDEEEAKNQAASRKVTQGDTNVPEENTEETGGEMMQGPPEEEEVTSTEEESAAEADQAASRKVTQGDTMDGGEAENDEAEKIKAENEALKKENAELKEAIKTSGEKSAAAVAKLSGAGDEAGEEGSSSAVVGAYPRFEISAMMYGTPEEQQAAADKYTEELVKFLTEKNAPQMAKYAEAKRYMANLDAAEVLSHMDELKGFGDMRPRLDEMIKSHAILSNWEDPFESYITAYLIQKGIEAMEKEGVEPTVEELMNVYRNNTSFRDAVERERLEALKKMENIPPTPESAGMGSAEPYRPTKAKSLREAREIARKAFRG